jgi:signal transduction histidine kinase
VLLDKTLRSSTLKLAAIYIGVVGAAIVGLFAYVYWVSLSFARDIAARGIGMEQALQHFDRSLALALGGAVGMLLLLAVAAGVSTSRRSVSRIEAINTASREIMRAGLGQRIPLRGTGDEWDELAANLNSMLARIEELVEANRQVSDNLAHDLRTPLTRVRGRLEKAYHRPPDSAEYPALIARTIAELDGILKTFSSLLRISRIEVQERGEGFRAVDLGALAREVVELFEPAAEETGVALRVSGAGSVTAIGDRDLLFDALSNLMDNAIKHGGRDGSRSPIAGPASRPRSGATS